MAAAAEDAAAAAESCWNESRSHWGPKFKAGSDMREEDARTDDTDDDDNEVGL